MATAEAINQIREIVISGNSAYGFDLPEFTTSTDLATWAQPILSNSDLQNAFVKALMNKIVYTSYNVKNYRNPLAQLEGFDMPIGFSIENAHINPATGVNFNDNDFAGILRKYEADVKTEYFNVNYDRQFAVTISRKQLRKAFTNIPAFEGFVAEMTNSLWNGAYIEQFARTKALVSTAYENGNIKVETVSAVTDKESAEAFLIKARGAYLAFQFPSTDNTGWKATGQSAGREVKTWSNPEDIVILLSSKVAPVIDVTALSAAFNIDKASLQGRVIYVDNFDVYSDDGETKIFDGSSILGMVADKSWFRINNVDTAMDTFYNAKNRTTQAFLNVEKIYGYSLFANAICFATAQPTVETQSISFGATKAEIEAGDHEGFDMTIKPASAAPTIAYEVIAVPEGGEPDDLTLTSSEGTKHVDIAVAAQAVEGTYVVKASTDELSSLILINVPAA